VTERHGGLRGYRFLARVSAGNLMRCGFFVGYLVRDTHFGFLQPQSPECIVFVFVEAVGGEAHRRLVVAEGSLLRRTAEYIRWLTHRPPRFVFFDDQSVVLVRHFPTREWPQEKQEHYARNFFIETLAWLVRSGLVKRLLAASSRRGEQAERAAEGVISKSRRKLPKNVTAVHLGKS
jgi:hypothetical protein